MPRVLMAVILALALFYPAVMRAEPPADAQAFLKDTLNKNNEPRDAVSAKWPPKKLWLTIGIIATAVAIVGSLIARPNIRNPADELPGAK